MGKQGIFRRAVAISTAAITASLLLATTASAGTKPAPGGGWLFVQTAKQASLKPAGKGGTLRLTLTQPTARVQGFADRPQRTFDLQSLTNFVGSWKAYGFTKTPPNAAIVSQNGGAKQDVLIVKLTKPKLAKNGSLTYLATPLKGQAPADLRGFARRADKKLPANLGPASLFIDDADDTTTPVIVEFVTTTPSYTAAFSLPGPLFLSDVDSVVGVNIHIQTPQVTVGFPTGSPSNFNRPPNLIIVDADPVGNCVPLDLTQQSTPGTITANAGQGLRPISPGVNWLPTGSFPDRLCKG